MGFLDSLIGGITGSSSNDAARYAADKQWAVADKIQRREDRLFAFWRTFYKQCELDLNYEVYTLPDYRVDYKAITNEAEARTREQFNRGRQQLINDLIQTCGRMHCGTTKELDFARASANAATAAMLFRLEEQIELTRDQQRREEQYRMAAFGHGAYFSTAGSQLALQTYSQQLQAALRQGSGSAAGLGYFMQSALKLFNQATASPGGMATNQTGSSLRSIEGGSDAVYGGDTIDYGPDFDSTAQTTVSNVYTPVDSGIDYTTYDAGTLFNDIGGGAAI